MPRRRTIPDQDLLDAALVVVRDAGPEALTFAAAAQQSGLAASTIVQRFGSKAGLLRAALARAWDLLDEQTEAAAAAAGRGPQGVVDLLVQLSGSYDAHDFADQLRVLREDLRDPVLRERGQRWIGRLGQEVEARLGPGADGLGELVIAQWQGTLTVWSFTRATPLADAVRTALIALLPRLAPPPAGWVR
ncbi:MAG TPA: helix-turn-helix domain-containing protein [Pseudonocardia sp.]|nr:helix-turn-helix domain-containing protein [Pseudonocardia sp.]